MSADDTVEDILMKSPFVTGGALDLSTGEGTFVELEMHREFKERVLQMSAQEVTLWALSGPIGIGRTWTMSWLGRQAVNDNMGDGANWEAALVSGLTSGEIRSLVETIFSSTEYLREDISENLGDSFMRPRSDDMYRAILEYALEDNQTWSVLTGNRGRFPDIPRVADKPRWPNRDTQVEFLIKWLELLGETEVDNIVVLIDEFETLVTRLSKNKLINLSDGIRNIYDRVTTQADNTPNIQFILSMTPEASNRITGGSSVELAGWIQPMRDRMSPSFDMSRMIHDEALLLAETAIDRWRVRDDIEGRFTPYTEESIELAFEVCEGLPRKFTKSLEEMYTIGRKEPEITEEIAKDAVQRLDDIDLESEELV